MVLIMRSIILAMLLLPSFAFAMTLSPAGPEASAYLNTNPVGVTPDIDGYLEVASPSETCQVHAGDPGWNWGTSYIGDLGNGQSLATYLTACSQPITDWTIDGDWYVRTYSDETFTTMLDEEIFCQGSGCGSPPPGPVATTTIEQILTQIHFDFLWLLFLITFICGILYFERYYKA